MAILSPTVFSEKAIAPAESQYKGSNVAEGVFTPSLVYGDTLRGKAVVIPKDGEKSTTEILARAIIELIANFYDDSILYGYRLEDYNEVLESIMQSIEANKGELHDLYVSNQLFDGIVVAEHTAKLSLLGYFTHDPENVGYYNENFLLGAFPKYSVAIKSFLKNDEREQIGDFLISAGRDNLKRFIDYGVETVGIDEMLNNAFGFYDSVIHEFTCLGVSYFVLRQN